MIIYANGYYPRGGLGQLNLEEDGKLYEYTTAPVDTTISGVRSHLVGCVNHIYENRWRVESLVLTKLEEDTASIQVYEDTSGLFFFFLIFLRAMTKVLY